MKKVKLIMMIIAIILVIVGIGFLVYGVVNKYTKKVNNPIATIEVQDYGTIKVELYPDKAPNTVTNFIRLANRGFYNGLKFHRTIPDFMIQGGDRLGDGTGSPRLSDIIDDGASDEYSIKGEFIANKYYTNNIKMERGVIAMARSDYSSISSSLAEKGYNSAGSQFFIMQKDNSNLDGLYAGFGKVIEGIDVVDTIANVEVYYRTNELKENEEAPKDEEGNQIASDKPRNDVIITSVTVDTFGVDYGVPETEEPFNYYNWLMKYYNFNS